MADSWYNWYYYEELEIVEARETIGLLESRMVKICEDKEKRQCSGTEKKTKLRKIKQQIDALKYMYSIWDIGNNTIEQLENKNIDTSIL